MLLQTTSDRLHEVRSYFDNGDTHVGYRRLLDSAIETGDMQIYADTLKFCDWYDVYHAGNPADPAPLIQQVSQLLEKIGQVPDPAWDADVKPVVKAENLSKTYARGNFSLSSLNFDVYPTQITGLVGENGNGKTTLLRLLYGELHPDAGSIRYNLGSEKSLITSYDVKTRLGFIPQRPDAWYGSLMDNLQFTSTHYGFKGHENFLWTEVICARMGLRAFRTYTWSRISSGYKMRFELAKTLLKNPEVLLLDEPLANLDVLAQQVILEDLRFLAQSRRHPMGIILSSQQLYEVEKVSEQVIFLKEGKPRYQQTRQATSEPVNTPLVFELESTASRETLQAAFSSLGIINIAYNGGVYLLYFPDTVRTGDVIRRLGESDLPVKYFRDISLSSRRFFNA